MTVTASSRGWESIEIAALKSAVARNGFAYWDRLRAGRGFPARSDVSARGAASLLRHVVILSVLAEPADYLFRLVGDEVTRAYDAVLNQKKVSEIDAVLPGAGGAVKGILDGVRAGGKPVAYRNWFETKTTGETFNYREAVFMPLGHHAPVVDHILVVDAPV